MGIRLIVALFAFAIVQVAAPAAFAQDRVQLVAWGEQLQGIQGHTTSATEAVSALSGTFRDIRSREQFLAAARAMAPSLTLARDHLAAARTGLDQLPSPDVFEEPDTIAFATGIARDLRGLVEGLDSLLADMQQLEPAIVANNSARVIQIADRMETGVILIINGQANAIRSQQIAWEPTESDYHILASTASLYDGMAAIFSARGVADRQPIEAAAEAMRTANAAARETIAAERTALGRIPAAQRRYETRQLDLNLRTIEELERAAAALGVIPGAINGDVNSAYAAALARQFVHYEQRLQAISAEQAQIALEELR